MQINLRHIIDNNILNCIFRVELQFVVVRSDLPEQTKWLLHNRMLHR